MGLMKVRDLVDWLNKQDPDGLIYCMEYNTGDYQEIPNNFPNLFIQTVPECKQSERSWLNNWYKNNKDKDKLVEKEFNNTFKYTKDNGVIFRM